MRILVVSNFFPPSFIGGAEIVAAMQARRLMELGHEVRVLAGDTQRRVPGYPVREDSFDGLPVTRVALQPSDFAPHGNNVAHPEVDAVFVRLIEAWRPDVVHAHHLLGLSVGILRAARARGIRTVLTLHDHWGFCLRSTRITTTGAICQDTTRCADCMRDIVLGDDAWPIRFRQDYLRWQLGAVDAFVSPSRYLADAYVATGLPAERMHVIGNGLELDRFTRLAPSALGERLHLLFIGHMGEHKGVPVLLDALARLPAERLHVDFVGHGADLAEYERFVRNRLPKLSFRFWGQLPNERILERLGQTHVFVLPSICPENQPVTITEAMASGLPVVASRIGGIPELVEDGVTGQLAEPGDAAALARCIGHYLSEPQRIGQHGEAGRSAIRRLAVERQIERLEGLLVQPALPAAWTPPVIACYGRPHRATFDAMRGELTPVPAGRPQPATQPCWIPAAWVEPAQGDILWVAQARRIETALETSEAWLAAGRPVVVDARTVLLRPHLDDRVLPVRGPEQQAVALRLLLRHGRARERAEFADEAAE